MTVPSADAPFQSLEALAAIVRDEYLVVAPNYIYSDPKSFSWRSKPLAFRCVVWEVQRRTY